jgi:hypothetical protein
MNTMLKRKIKQSRALPPTAPVAKVPLPQLPPLKLPQSHVLPIFALGQRPAYNSALADRFYIASNLFNSSDPANDSLYLWGCLVKSWATGTNHFPDKTPTDPFPARPATGTGLASILDALGINYNLPKRFSKVVFSQTTADILAIHLPAKDACLNKERQIYNGINSYAIPAYYPEFFGPLTPLSSDKQTSIYVDTLRVGEYSMNNCA